MLRHSVPRFPPNSVSIDWQNSTNQGALPQHQSDESKVGIEPTTRRFYSHTLFPATRLASFYNTTFYNLISILKFNFKLSYNLGFLKIFSKRNCDGNWTNWVWRWHLRFFTNSRCILLMEYFIGLST